VADLVDLEDLEGALSPATIVQCWDDDRDGVADPIPLGKMFKRASAQVRSWLPGHYGLGVSVDTDELLRAAALDFAVAYTFERHPEYVRTFGEAPRAEKWKRGEDIMGRVKAGIQRPVDVEAVQGPSKTIGGVITEHGPRMFSPNADGTSNSGDF
jgi:hypothetical protein